MNAVEFLLLTFNTTPTSSMLNSLQLKSWLMTIINHIFVWPVKKLHFGGAFGRNVTIKIIFQFYFKFIF
jgi:hypothetical protein